MSDDDTIEQLLKWRSARAEAEAMPAPRASRLLELARPWWTTCPEQFQRFWARLGSIQVAYGHAMVKSPAPHDGGYPVPALILREGETEVEASVHVLYLGTRDRRMSLRFLLKSFPEYTDSAFEVTFVSELSALPLFSAPALRSVDNEFRLDVELTDEIARDWKNLRVIDRMPFRLILRLPAKVV